MSYNKCHSNIGYENEPSVRTPLNQTNLNYTDNCVDILDNRVVSLDSNKLGVAAANGMFTDVSIDANTGILTFTKYDGSTKTLDTMLEKVVTNFNFDETTQKLTITLQDGSTKEVDLSAFIKETEFSDSDTISWSVVNHKAVASVKNHSITADHLQTDYYADLVIVKGEAEGARDAAQGYAGNASDYADDSKDSQYVSEGYATGTRDGVEITDTTSPYYHNNARFYKDQAQAIAEGSLSALSDVEISNPTNNQSLIYNSTSNKWVNGSNATEVVNNLTSTDTDKALSANMGKSLKDAVDGKAASSHTHTKSEITDFPSTMTPSAHTHTKSDITDFPSTMTPSAHNQAASTITAGTLAGKVNANATAAATVTTAQVRDIYAGTSALTANSSALTTGTIYVMYE